MGDPVGGADSPAAVPPPVRVARVFWDYENVAIPNGVPVEDLMNQLYETLRSRLNLELDGSIKVYGSSKQQSRAIVERLQDLGCECIDPHKQLKKAEVVDTRIVADMAAFALTRVKDSRPSAAVLITSDQGFAYMVNILRNHQLDVIVISGHSALPPRLVSAASTTLLLSEILAGPHSPSSLGASPEEEYEAKDALISLAAAEKDQGAARGSSPATPSALSRAGTVGTHALYMLRIVNRCPQPTGTGMYASNLGAQFHEKHSQHLQSKEERNQVFKAALSFAKQAGLLQEHGVPPSHTISITLRGRDLLQRELDDDSGSGGDQAELPGSSPPAFSSASASNAASAAPASPAPPVRGGPVAGQASGSPSRPVGSSLPAPSDAAEFRSRLRTFLQLAAAGESDGVLTSRLGQDFHEQHSQPTATKTEKQAVFQQVRDFAKKQDLISVVGIAPKLIIELTDKGHRWLRSNQASEARSVQDSQQQQPQKDEQQQQNGYSNGDSTPESRGSDMELEEDEE